MLTVGHVLAVTPKPRQKGTESLRLCALPFPGLQQVRNEFPIHSKRTRATNGLLAALARPLAFGPVPCHFRIFLPVCWWSLGSP